MMRPNTRLMAAVVLAAGTAVSAVAQEGNRPAQPVPGKQDQRPDPQGGQPQGEPQAVSEGVSAEARSVLERATEALRRASLVRAQFALTARAPEMFVSLVPSANGQVAVRRGGEPAMRVGGTYRATNKAEAEQIDFLVRGETGTTLDHGKKQIVERSLSDRRVDARFSPLRGLDLGFLTSSEPYGDELRAVEAVVEETQSVDGVACDVVLVTYTPAGGRPAAGKSHTQARWFFGKEDGLPRRVEKISASQLGDMAVIMEFSRVTAGGEAPAGTFEMEAPEGYSVDGPRRPIRPNDVLLNRREGGDALEQTGTSGAGRETVRSATQGGEQAAREGAPAFSLTAAEGGRVFTNESQKGRVTVLYFWGTWCVPCREYSPLVSAMAEKFEGRAVDVLAPAVRERNPDAPKAYFRDQGYKSTLVEGGGMAARGFKIRVYPTIVVLGKDGAIVEQWRPDPQISAEELMKSVPARVAGALTGCGRRRDLA